MPGIWSARPMPARPPPTTTTNAIVRHTDRNAGFAAILARIDLTISHLWNGEPAPASEHARVRLRDAGSTLHIAVAAPLHGDPAPPGLPGPVDQLWEHEVVEVFIASASGPDGARPYTEIELSPWGHHLVLRLQGIRRQVAGPLPLRYRVRHDSGRWLGAARIEASLLPRLPWLVNAFAIHGSGPQRRYLAATPLPGERPDFHQPARFSPFTG